MNAALEERAWVDLREHDERCAICGSVGPERCRLGVFYMGAWYDARRGIVRTKPRWVALSEFSRPPEVR